METPPSPELLIYFFADSFIPSANGPFTQVALAPRTADRLDLKKLVTRLYAAVFMDLANQDALRLAPAEIRKFLITTIALVAEPRPAAAQPAISTLAGQILGRIKPGDDPSKNRVRELLIRQVGGRESTSTPWLDALAPVITESVRCGYVTLPEKQPAVLTRLFNPSEARTRVVPDLERINALRATAIQVNGRLDQFLAYQGETGQLLLQEIEAGINACQRRSD